MKTTQKAFELIFHTQTYPVYTQSAQRPEIIRHREPYEGCKKKQKITIVLIVI